MTRPEHVRCENCCYHEPPLCIKGRPGQGGELGWPRTWPERGCGEFSQHWPGQTAGTWNGLSCLNPACQNAGMLITTTRRGDRLDRKGVCKKCGATAIALATDDGQWLIYEQTGTHQDQAKACGYCDGTGTYQRGIAKGEVCNCQTKAVRLRTLADAGGDIAP